MKVIGNARLNTDAFLAWRHSEEGAAWIGEHWNSYFRSLSRELFDCVTEGFSRIGYSGFRYKASERFDEEFKEITAYMEAAGFSWDLCYFDNFMAILQFAAFRFALPIVFVEPKEWENLDDFSIAELRGRIGSTPGQGIVPKGELSLRGMKGRIQEKQDEIQAKAKEIEDIHEKKKKELEQIKAEIEAKYAEKLDIMNRKKAEMELAMKKLDQELFVLNTEIYGIRCFLGEVIQFIPIVTGKAAKKDAPVVLYQKLRFLDEELGKYLAIYGFDGRKSDTDYFEDVLRNRVDLQELLAPGEKSITLLRASKTNRIYLPSEDAANVLEEYEKLHGKKIGILLRNGENIFIGWTDEEQISIPDGNMFYQQKEEYHEGDRAEKSSTKEDIASRYFIFSILQGLLAKQELLSLPEEAEFSKSNPYVIYSMADAWLEDNRFGTFSNIVKRTNHQPLQKGDFLLTTMNITRDDRYNRGGFFSNRSTYMDAWNNDRGRGDKNRTHDAALANQTIYPVNLLDRTDTYRVWCKKYNCIMTEKVLSEDDTSKRITWEAERTDEFLGEVSHNIHVENLHFCCKDVRGWSKEQLYDYILSENYLGIRENKIDFSYNEKPTAYYEVPDRIEFLETDYQPYLSAEKSANCWADTKISHANMEIYPDEYLNLTYLNSAWILYAIQNRKMGGWKIKNAKVDYATSLPYLNIALEYLRKREKEEETMITPYMELYPDWQVDLSEWKIEKQYHRLTKTRAKGFAKWVEEKRKRQMKN